MNFEQVHTVRRPLINVEILRDNYIPELDVCDCGSRTYGYVVSIWSWENNKREKVIQCGGCDKIITLENIRLVSKERK